MANSLADLTAQRRNLLSIIVVALALAQTLITVLAFFGVWRNDFVNYDDNTYVFLNQNVTRGLDWQTVEWAFGHINACHWVPFTWLSHALDCQLFGLNPTGHHLTSLILHTATVVTLFFALQLLTGSIWRSALTAALFGIHPLRVESVAWVAERKDVLSGLFFALTLLTYAKYVMQVGAPKTGVGSAALVVAAPVRPRVYWLCVALFACGLMSKPMLVTMPCVLLLLDFWPLQRIDITNPQQRLESLLLLVKEKVPFLVLSLIVSGITLMAQSSFMANAANTSGIPLALRLANAALACVNYLRQTFWPANLAVFYPPETVSLFSGRVLVALAILLLVTITTLRVWKGNPAVSMGWLWFLGVLTPVSGIVQAGEMIQADRFTYLPSIGVFIALVWTGGVLASRWSQAKIPLAVLSMAALVVFGVVTQRQVGVWRNTETLFAHANKVTRDNYVALAARADVELAAGSLAEAAATIQRIIEIKPGFPRGQCLMATVLQRQGRMQEAIPYLERSVGPEVFTVARARMVLSLLDAGRLAEAEVIMAQLLQAMPNDPDAWLMKAALLREQGRGAEALELFRKVTEVYQPQPQDTPLFNFELAELYCLADQSAKAVEFYEKALAAHPDYVDALNNLAWLLATHADAAVRNGDRAVTVAERACQLTEYQQPLLLGTLAAAYAEAGRFDQAVSTAVRAQAQAQSLGAANIAQRNAELLKLYREGKPYHEPAP